MYFNTWKSKENVLNNEDVVEKMVNEFDVDMKEHEPLVFEVAQVADAINRAREIIKGGKVAVDIDFYEDGEISVDEAETVNTEKKKDKEKLLSTSTLYDEDLDLPIDDIIEAINTELECECEWATIK